MHEEFIKLPNRLAQLVIPAPNDPKIHMDPISIDDDEYDASSNDMEFDDTPLLAPIVDDTRIRQSGQEPRTPSDSHITFDVASEVSSEASSDADEDVDSVQRMDIDAPHTTIPDTPRERETDPTIDDPTTSSSAIIADPAKVPEPRSKIDRPTFAPVRFSARLAEKRGHTIDDPQPSVHTIYAVDPVDNLYSNSNSNNSNDRERAATIFIAVYVDDLVIASKNQSAIDATIHNLNKTFNVRSLGPISRFLSLNIVCKGLRGEIHISQTDYIQRILKRFHMMDCNPVKTPAITGMKLHIHEEGTPQQTPTCIVRLLDPSRMLRFIHVRTSLLLPINCPNTMRTPLQHTCTLPSTFCGTSKGPSISESHTPQELEEISHQLHMLMHLMQGTLTTANPRQATSS
jgi:Reverse transcriptase (RNA-dependent DNA polymerase)